MRHADCLAAALTAGAGFSFPTVGKNPESRCLRNKSLGPARCLFVRAQQRAMVLGDIVGRNGAGQEHSSSNCWHASPNRPKAEWKSRAVGIAPRSRHRFPPELTGLENIFLNGTIPG